MDKMLFGFASEHSRNAAGRAARAAGYECRGTNLPTMEPAYLLTVDEALDQRRSAVNELILRTSPGADRLR